MRVKIRLDFFLVAVVLYGSLIKQIYSYYGVEYKLNEGSTYAYQQLATGNAMTVFFSILIIMSILILFIMQIGKIRLRKGYWLLIFGLVSGVFIWTIVTTMDIGITSLLYADTAPFVYGTALAVVVGMNNELFSFFLKHTKWIGFGSIVLSLISYVLFLMEHTGELAVLANSSTLVFYVQGFWLICIWCFCGEEKIGWKIYIILGLLVFLAVLFNSRSWVVQVVIWWLAYTYFQDRKKGVIKMLKILVVVGIISYIVYVVVNQFAPELLLRFIEKTSQDTRSQQYKDLFAQTNFWDFIVGKGYEFQYNSQLQGGNYSYIDNAYLLMLIRYGVIIGLIYPLIFFAPIITGLRKRGWAREYIPILMWLMALGGLSIYCVITVDIKSFAIAMVVGRCIYLNSMTRKKRIISLSGKREYEGK